MGHHGLWGKGNATFPANMYEESVKVPFIVSQPGTIPQAATCDSLLSHYDFMPTLLDYLHLPHPGAADCPGRSYAPLLRGEALAEPTQPVFLCDEYGPTRMIRTRRWKLIHRYPYGPDELYDLQTDPTEMNNLSADLSTIYLIPQLLQLLEDWFARYTDPRIDGAREAVTGKGQLDRAGLFAQGRSNYATDWHYIDADGRKREDMNISQRGENRIRPD
jgi:arylsulfatase A-like enzyme